MFIFYFWALDSLLMMLTRNFLVRQKGGLGRGGGRDGRSEKCRLDRNSDVRRKRSHMSSSVKDVGCEEQ